MVIIATALAALPSSTEAQTLAAIRARGHVICAVTPGQQGFSDVDSKGRWSGFDVDFCSALAAAVLGRSDAYRAVAVTAAERDSRLAAGEVDVAVRGAEHTLGREAASGTRYAGTLYYEAQGVMVPRAQGIESALELSGATLCAEANVAAVEAASDYFTGRRMRHKLITFEKSVELVSAYRMRRCSAVTADMSALAMMRLHLPQPSEHDILPERLALAAFGPIVPRGDEKWARIVRWTIYALIAAEDLDLSRATMDTARTATSSSARRFLDLQSNPGAGVGLASDFAAQIVRAVGNYGEMYERNLGRRSPLLLDRGVNNLWRNGGLLYAPPFR
jgi:general L-amino acid transport system substrate-binding protein